MILYLKQSKRPNSEKINKMQMNKKGEIVENNNQRKKTYKKM